MEVKAHSGLTLTWTIMFVNCRSINGSRSVVDIRWEPIQRENHFVNTKILNLLVVYTGDAEFSSSTFSKKPTNILFNRSTVQFNHVQWMLVNVWWNAFSNIPWRSTHREITCALNSFTGLEVLADCSRPRDSGRVSPNVFIDIWQPDLPNKLQNNLIGYNSTVVFLQFVQQLRKCAMIPHT